jgi:hypothetical protein
MMMNSSQLKEKMKRHNGICRVQGKVNVTQRKENVQVGDSEIGEKAGYWGQLRSKLPSERIRIPALQGFTSAIECEHVAKRQQRYTSTGWRVVACVLVEEAID